MITQCSLPSKEEKCPLPPVYTYVDDGFLLPADKQIDQVTLLSQDSVDKVDRYMISNGLLLNLPKTSLMTAPPTTGTVTIMASGHQVTSTPTIKALGVIFSQDLTWDKHAMEMLKQLNHKLSILRVIQPLVSFKTIRMIATAIVIGKVTYSLPLWGNLSLALQAKFQTVILTAAIYTTEIPRQNC